MVTEASAVEADTTPTHTLTTPATNLHLHIATSEMTRGRERTSRRLAMQCKTGGRRPIAGLQGFSARAIACSCRFRAAGPRAAHVRALDARRDRLGTFAAAWRDRAFGGNGRGGRQRRGGRSG